MNWLLIRGLVREQRHWGDFPQAFKRHLEKNHSSANVMTIDYPGFGNQKDRLSPFSISEIVDDMRMRFYRENPERKKWNLFSVSLGGMVGVNWVSRYPEDFERIVLVNSSLRGLSPIHHRLNPQKYSKILSLFFEGDRKIREKEILKMTSNLVGDALEARANYNAEFAEHIRKRDALAQIVAATRFKAPQKIALPMLVLCSEKDQLVSVNCSEAIAKQFKASLQKNESANHDLPLDDPEWIFEKMSEWTKG